ncbi:DUF6069 family protein [Streptomyces sp. NRRL F-2664]|uniref:DUF6069 family protein n=1 Tax=Streptomyces sp. NRRL F-2664 TaxID=1463842 RepID=UPI00068E3E2F|nr:DUF6069 family protein [Streptomyces sp. NRRL F-2664]
MPAELRRRGLPATFFPTGAFADAHPAAARTIGAAHGLGNHSYSHPSFDRLSTDRRAEEVRRADAAIRRASGREPLPFFRFPYSATTEDERAIDALAAGAIIQMHVGSNGGGTVLDAEALPLIIDAAEAEGYTIVDLRAFGLVGCRAEGGLTSSQVEVGGFLRMPRPNRSPALLRWGNSMSNSALRPSDSSSAGSSSAGSARSARRSGFGWWKVLVIGAVGAAVANLVVFAVAKLAGASLVVLDAGEEHAVTVGGVVGASVVPLVAGTGAALLLGLWRPVFLRIAQYAGSGLALLSVAGPLSSDADGGTVAALTLMHLTLGVAVFTTLHLHRHRSRR